MERINRLAAQLSSGAAAATADEPAAPGGSGLVGLTEAQLSQFITAGYVLVQPRDGELPPSFHDNYYERTADMFDVSRHKEENQEHQANRNLGSMTTEINQLLAAPTCHGALRSLLGPDFMVATWGNGTPLLHAPNPQADVDQSWHKVRSHSRIACALL